MTDQDAAKKDDDLPPGFTLIDPNATAAPAASGSDDVPKGFTLIPMDNAPGSGVLQNPGGDLPTGGGGAPTPVLPTPPPQKSFTGFLGNALSSTGNLLGNVAKSIVNLDAKNVNDAIPLKKASDSLFDLFYGAGREAARRHGWDLEDSEEGAKGDQALAAFREHIANYYGSWQKFKDALYTDPAGVGADLSMLASGGETGAEAMGLEGAARVAGGVSHVANPLYLPSKIVSGGINLFAPKLPAGGFDPREVSFGEATGTPATPTAAPQVDEAALKQQATADRAYQFAKLDRGERAVPGRDDWLKAEEDIRKNWKPPEAETPKAAAPAADTTNAAKAQSAYAKAYNLVKGYVLPAVGGGGAYLGVQALTHHIVQGLLGGALSFVALDRIPALLRSPYGQDILAQLAKGSPTAELAGKMRDLVPKLNAMQRQAENQQTIDLSKSPYLHAQGGAVNHELARIQCERLPLRDASIRALRS